METWTYKNLGRVGRLGNQLWEIAGIAGLSNGQNFYVRPSWDYKSYFSLPDPAYVKPKGTKIIDGGTEYFQDLRYWSHIVDEVHGWFQPSEKSLEIMRVNYDLDHMKSLTTCSIHVRRGDYLENPNLFPFVGLNYYKNAINKVCSLDDNVTFFVFSDDIEWCKENFSSIDKNFVYIKGVARPVEVRDRKGEPEDQFDLFLMTECDYHIISNSTFSWWGAFLSDDKNVLYPSRWYGPGLSNINWKLMIPNSWEMVEV